MCLCLKSYPQTSVKKPLDSLALKNWISVGDGHISMDGLYIYYCVYNEPAGQKKIIVQSLNNSWKYELINTEEEGFISNGQYLIYKKQDTLSLLKLGTDSTLKIPDVTSYKILAGEESTSIGYKTRTNGNDLVLFNFLSGDRKIINSVGAYDIEGRYLVFQPNQKDAAILSIFDLASGFMKIIRQTDHVKLVCHAWNKNFTSISYITEDLQTRARKLCLFDMEADSTRTILKDGDKEIGNSFSLSDRLPEFSESGNNLFFFISPKKAVAQSMDLVSMEVWSYRDGLLQSQQSNDLQLQDTRVRLFVINQNKFLPLQQQDEEIVGKSNGFILVQHALGNRGYLERYWNKKAEFSYDLVSVESGMRITLKSGRKIISEGLSLSPGGAWVIYYDYGLKNYFSYETATGIIRNITKGASNIWTNEESTLPVSPLPGRQFWLANEERVMIYDAYDIWLVDPTGRSIPYCITRGLGKRNHIKFEILFEHATSEMELNNHPVILLKAFNRNDKTSGFYSITLNDRGEVQKLNMGPYVFNEWIGDNVQTIEPEPVKAKWANVYLLLRMSATEAPNYVITSDFKSYHAISNVQPQKGYNWLTTELVTWKTFSGKMAKGILYKPENFDSTKKYPIIFDYYETRSNELNQFIQPKFAEGRINIPFFVSNDYLVFTPDILYDETGPGKSAYNAVVSAAKYLGKKAWVNAKAMGIQGHSFGGYETNFIITQTNIFSAACSASGFCDLISWYTSGTRSDYPMYWAEQTQGRFGRTPWEATGLYLSNSPILYSDRVGTPLLMMNNKKDPVVPFWQGLEYFTALRRLGKRVWMLEYDDGVHVVVGKAAEDYTIRLFQFFDHYLKGLPPPQWMTIGIPASEKGSKSGLDVDMQIQTPGAGLTDKK